MNNKYVIPAVMIIVAIVLVTFGLLILGLGVGIGQLRQIFVALAPQTALVLGVGSVVLLLSAWLIASALRRSHEQRVESQRRIEQSKAYAGVLQSLLERLQVDPPPDRFNSVEAALLLWGSLAVLKEYQNVVEVISGRRGVTDETHSRFNRLLMAMRRDLGADPLGMTGINWLGHEGKRETAPPPSEPNFVLQPRSRMA